MADRVEVGGGDIQLLGFDQGEETASSPQFTLTTISWQKNNITIYHEVCVYCVLFVILLSSASLALYAFIGHHIEYLIIGLFGGLISLSMCGLYYIRHCFGMFFKHINKITFDENTANVGVRQNDILVASIPFNKFVGVSYQDHFIFVHKAQNNNYNMIIPGAENENSPPAQDIIGLNKYRCDSNQGHQFVLTITDIWPLIFKKYQKSGFQPISIV